MKAYLLWTGMPQQQIEDVLWMFEKRYGRFEVYLAEAGLMSVDGRVLGKCAMADGEGNINYDVLQFLDLDAWEYGRDKPARECRRCSEQQVKEEGRCQSCGLIWEDDWLRESQNAEGAS